MKKIVNMALLSLLISFISCSEKSDLLEESKSYGKVYFVNNSILDSYIGIKYMGEPYKNIAFVGPGTFTFYNKRSGEVLLEKELEVKANDTEPWYIFQPDSTIALQLIRNPLATEQEPPVGYFKLKIAYFCKNALPYQKLDVIINSYNEEDWTTKPLDTLSSVGSSLETAEFFVIKKTDLNLYTFSFIDHDTQNPILDKAGNLYVSGLSIAPQADQNISICYLAEQEIYPFDGFIFKNNKYYDIIPNLLFQ